MDFYAYHLMVWDNSFNQILRFKDVTNQFIVDMYTKIETERLLYIHLNQKTLRAEQYIHFKDTLQRDGNASNVGQQIIHSSTVTGSPRYMHKRTQDAMSYVHKFGHPDLFITFTCNPNWIEIRKNLFTGQVASDRHDILLRSFRLKLLKLIWLLKKGSIFGSLQG